MLWLWRNVFHTCGDRNCLVLDLPSGERIRIWLVTPKRHLPGVRPVGVFVDAPRDVVVTRGELLSPLDTQPDVRLTESQS